MHEFLSESGYWALLLTVAAYQLGLFLNKKTKSAIFHPIVVASVLIVPILLLANIPNDTYQAGMKSISWLLTPCTVCLGISLYTQLNKLKNHLGAILAGVAAGTATSLLMIWGLCALFGLDKTITVSLLPKSVTTAMAQPLAEGAGGIGALATAAVIVTGIMGSILGPALCKLFRLKNEIARGVALGTASHVVGTTKAAEMSELTGAVSSLSLVVAGILTAIVFSFLT
jgi:predicted murein hydrolase (TIGR00659 family)